MSTKYYLSKRPNSGNRHHVHQDDCPFITDNKNMIYLGEFNSEEKALIEGEKYVSEATCCRFCLKEGAENEAMALTSETYTWKIFPTNDQLMLRQQAGMSYLLN
jgi:hypothetical protein